MRSDLKNKAKKLSGVKQPFRSAEGIRRRTKGSLNSMNLITDPQMLIDAIPQIVWSCTADGSMDYANQRWIQFTGGQPIHRWIDAVHPQDVEQTSTFMRERLTGTAPFEFQFRLRRSDQTYQWMLAQANPVFDSAGNIIRWMGTCTNIEEQRKATEWVRESEELWRTFTNSISQIAWIANGDGVTTWFNDRWYEFTGMETDQPLAGVWEYVIHPDHRERILKKIAHCLASGENWEEAVPLRGRSGEYSWFLSSGFPMRDEDGRIFRWFGTNTDITKQLQLTEQVVQREEHLRIATDAAKLGIWTCDLQTMKVKWSKQTAIIHGQPGVTDLFHGDVVERIFPDDRPRVEEALQHVVSHPPFAQPAALEIRIVRPSGDIRWVALSAMKLEEIDVHRGSRELVIGTILDITERLEKERELKAARDAAESANAAKSAFLANMSHEMRTPLSAIMGFTSLLRSKEISDADREKFLDTISRTGKTLTGLIDDILDLSKVEAGHLTLEKAYFSLPDLLEECVFLFREKAREKGLILSLTLEDPSCLMIWSDSARIRQIIINLVGNAVKFTKAGQVTVRLSTTLSANNADIRIAVEDTGIGLTEEQKSRIFHRFTQADNSMTRSYGGTGLGLALSRRLAWALGGDIVVEDRKGGTGCLFSLHFSAKTSDSRTDPIDLKSECEISINQPLRGLRILVAEDSPEIRFLLDQFLSAAGATVSLADDGQKAVIEAGRTTFDAIIMDIQMPILDGYQATRAIRAAKFEGPIIALTAHAMREDKAKTFDAGCDSHLTKPIDPERLFSEILRLRER